MICVGWLELIRMRNPLKMGAHTENQGLIRQKRLILEVLHEIKVETIVQHPTVSRYGLRYSGAGLLAARD
jgi:hypothetical protein